jgi:outer membrane biosynthesis protein TonB
MGSAVIAAVALLAIMIPTVAAQEKPPADQKYDVKRCAPKVVSHARRPKQESIHPRPGEKSTGFLPVIAYQILDTGKVTQAYVKRSSGIADIDTIALNWIRGTRYNTRSGCGVIETQAVVTIDLGSAD